MKPLSQGLKTLGTTQLLFVAVATEEPVLYLPSISSPNAGCQNLWPIFTRIYTSASPSKKMSASVSVSVKNLIHSSDKPSWREDRKKGIFML